jgi:hypothetical protein
MRRTDEEEDTCRPTRMVLSSRSTMLGRCRRAQEPAAPQIVLSEHQSDELGQRDAVCSKTSERVCVLRTEPTSSVTRGGRRSCGNGSQDWFACRRDERSEAKTRRTSTRGPDMGGSSEREGPTSPRSGIGGAPLDTLGGWRSWLGEEEEEELVAAAWIWTHCMPLKRAKRGRAAHRQTPPRRECILLLLLLLPTFGWSRCRSFRQGPLGTRRSRRRRPRRRVRRRCRRRRPSPPCAPRERGRNALVRPRAPDGREDASDLVIDWPERAEIGPTKEGTRNRGVGDNEPNHDDHPASSERGGPDAYRANGNRSTSGASACPSRRSSRLTRCTRDRQLLDFVKTRRNDDYSRF